MKKLLLITAHFHPSVGGVQTYISKVAQNLCKKDINVTVFAPVADGLSHFHRYPVMKVYRYDKDTQGFLFLPMRTFLKELIKKEYHHIIASWWIPSAFFAWFFFKIFGTRYSLLNHSGEIWFSDLLPFGNVLLIKIFNKAFRVFVVGEWTGEELVKKGVDRERISVTYCGTEYGQFYPMVKSKNLLDKHNLHNKKIIFTVSRVEGYKGFDTVIKALPKVKTEVPNAVYLIGGKGSYRPALEKMVDDMGLKGSVIFLGFIPDEELSDYYNLCDVFVMPSRVERKKRHAEGFGIVLAEANACEKPVIAGKEGGTRAAIRDGYNGLLVDAKSVDEVADAIITTLKDDDLAKALGKNGRKIVLEKFNWEKVTERILSEIENA